MVEGSAERVIDADLRQGFIDATNAKYDTSYTVDFLDPDVNGTYRVAPAGPSACSKTTSRVPHPLAHPEP